MRTAVMKLVSERSLFVSVCNVGCPERTRRPFTVIIARMAKVLLIDDDKKHSDLLKNYLKQFLKEMLPVYKSFLSDYVNVLIPKILEEAKHY